jgi:xanthine dehydrogenase molybdenum-binding subunit
MFLRQGPAQPPDAHAVVKRIDKSKAQALRGVKAVLTWEDIPDWRGGTPRVLRVLDRKVRFVGDAVALVAATTEKVALDATRLIDVECECCRVSSTWRRRSGRAHPGCTTSSPELSCLPVPPSLAPKPQRGLYGRRGGGIYGSDTITEGSFSYENIPNPCLPNLPAPLLRGKNRTI